MSGLPADDRSWFELVLHNQPQVWRLIAESCGGEVIEEGELLAAIVPRSPNRSFFNSVFYFDTDGLIEQIPRLAEAYDGAGVNAWTVWIPNDDERARAALQEAGHVLDATPRAMGLELAGLRVPEPDPELEIREEMDMESLTEINRIAYGYPPGDFPPMTRLPDTRCFLAGLKGKTVGTTLLWDSGDDVEVTLVATLPEARGRGIAGRLMGHALERERGRGKLASTLISTKLGFPVYEKLGYSDVGGFEMWEMRKPG